MELFKLSLLDHNGAMEALDKCIYIQPRTALKDLQNIKPELLIASLIIKLSSNLLFFRCTFALHTVARKKKAKNHHYCGHSLKIDKTNQSDTGNLINENWSQLANQHQRVEFETGLSTIF